VRIRGAACIGGDDEVGLDAPNADNKVHDRQGERDIVIFAPSSGSTQAVSSAQTSVMKCV
jgi:hypothetical protein